MRILAVDDDAIFLKLLTSILREAGYDAVTTAESAAHALETLTAAETPFDCFLLDIKMPGMDGIELCGEIRTHADYALTPILMLTALADDRSIERAFKAGANDYVTKPLRGLELGSRIRLAAQLQELRVRNLSLLQSRVLSGPASEQPHTAERPVVVPLSQVSGVVNFLELENYLLRMGDSVTALRMFALALQCPEHATEKSDGFACNELLRDLALAVSNTSNSPQSLIACPSDNVILFVSKGWHRVPVPAVTAATRQVLVDWFGETAGQSIEFHLCLDRTKSHIETSGRAAAERLRKLGIRASEELDTRRKQNRLQALRTYEPDPASLRAFFSTRKILPRRISRAPA